MAGDLEALQRSCRLYLTSSNMPGARSLDEQRSRCRSLVERHGYVLVDTYSNLSSGLGSEPNTALERLINDIRRDHGGVIAVSDLESLAGDFPDEAVSLIKLLRSGAVIHCAKNGIYDLDRNSLKVMRFIASIPTSFWIAEDLIGPLARALARFPGLDYCYGNAPYGFRVLRYAGGDLWVPDLDTARVVETMFELHDLGATFTEITSRWNKEGVVSHTGKRWRAGVVGTLLANPAHRGYQATSRLPEKEYPARIVIFVDQELVHRVQKRIRETPERPSRPRHPLTGLVHCGGCGKRVRVEAYKDGRKYYMCRGRTTSACWAAKVDVALLESEVLKRCSAITGKQEDADMHATGRIEADHGQGELSTPGSSPRAELQRYIGLIDTISITGHDDAEIVFRNRR